jgi:hypothetical protein
MADLLGDECYRDWAYDLAGSIYARSALRGGRILVPDDTGTEVTPGYGTGLSGVLAFLLRLRGSGPRLWLPHVLAHVGRDRSPTSEH